MLKREHGGGIEITIDHEKSLGTKRIAHGLTMTPRDQEIFFCFSVVENIYQLMAGTKLLKLAPFFIYFGSDLIKSGPFIFFPLK